MKYHYVLESLERITDRNNTKGNSQMATELDYVPGKSILQDENAFSISPSGLGKFFSDSSSWYKENFQGIKTFGQSTSTILGTIVHYCAEQHVKGFPIDTKQIYQYLYEQCCHPFINGFHTSEAKAKSFLLSQARLEFDIEHILYQYPLMASVLIDKINTLEPTKAEEIVSTEITPGYWAAGSVDLLCGQDLYDYKTTSALSAPKSISYEHKLQLLTYAYAHIKNGNPIRSINIIYVTTNVTGRTGTSGKPLADYPATATILTHYITAEDIDFIESILKLVAETAEYVKANPNLAYIIFRDYRLKSIIPKIKFTF